MINIGYYIKVYNEEFFYGYVTSLLLMLVSASLYKFIPLITILYFKLIVTSSICKLLNSDNKFVYGKWFMENPFVYVYFTRKNELIRKYELDCLNESVDVNYNYIPTSHDRYLMLSNKEIEKLRLDVEEVKILFIEDE